MARGRRVRAPEFRAPRIHAGTRILGITPQHRRRTAQRHIESTKTMVHNDSATSRDRARAIGSRRIDSNRFGRVGKEQKLSYGERSTRSRPVVDQNQRKAEFAVCFFRCSWAVKFGCTSNLRLLRNPRRPPHPELLLRCWSKGGSFCCSVSSRAASCRREIGQV